MIYPIHLFFDNKENDKQLRITDLIRFPTQLSPFKDPYPYFTRRGVWKSKVSDMVYDIKFFFHSLKQLAEEITEIKISYGTESPNQARSSYNSNNDDSGHNTMNGRSNSNSHNIPSEGSDNGKRNFLFYPFGIHLKLKCKIMLNLRDRPIFRTVFKILTLLGFGWVGGA